MGELANQEDTNILPEGKICKSFVWRGQSSRSVHGQTLSFGSSYQRKSVAPA